MEILDKINQQGYRFLTLKKDILKRAAERRKICNFKDSSS
jgi:hypothetical protein